MQFIQSIILIVVTTIVTNLFTRKFYISDKDRIIKEKQLKLKACVKSIKIRSRESKNQ